MLGYVRPADEETVKRELKFYFYAVRKKNAQPLNFDKSLFHSKYFCGHNRGSSLSWIAPVNSVKLMTADDIEVITGRSASKGGASYYYVLELGSIIEVRPVFVHEHVTSQKGLPVLLNLHDLFS